MQQQSLCEKENPLPTQDSATVTQRTENSTQSSMPSGTINTSRLEDPNFETVMLNPSIGDFTHTSISNGGIQLTGGVASGFDVECDLELFLPCSDQFDLIPLDEIRFTPNARSTAGQSNN